MTRNVHRLRAAAPGAALILFWTLTLAPPAKADPVTEYRSLPPDSTAARAALVAADPAGFQSAFDSVLVAVDPNAPGWADALDAAAADHLAATGDSILVSDLAFVRKADPAARARWAKAVARDADGFALRSQGDIPGSIAAFQEAAETYRALGDLRREAVAWGSLGVSYWYAGDFDGVGRAYGEALDARNRLGDAVLIGRTLNGLGSMHFQLGQNREALDYYRRAREVREKLDNRVDLATTTSYLGNVQYRMGNLIEAKARYQEALDIFGPDGSGRAYQGARVGLANVLTDLGETDAALAIYRDELAQAEASGDRAVATAAHRNIGSLLRSQGDPAGALRHLLKAHEIQAEDGNTLELARIDNDLGLIHFDLRDLPRAAEYFQAARDSAAVVGNENEKGSALQNLGLVYMEMGLYDRALANVEEALAAHRAQEDPGAERSALFTKGEILQHQGEHEQSLAVYQEVLAGDRERGDRVGEALDLVNVGFQLNALGRTDEAMNRYRESAALAREMDRSEILWRCYLGIGDSFERMGRLDSTRVYNRKAVDVLEASRAQGLSEEARTSFLGNWSYLYEAQIHVLGKMFAQKPDEALAAEAFAVAERGKSRALLDMLAESHVDLSGTLDPETARTREDMERRLNELRYRARKAEGENASADSLRALRKEIRNLEGEQKALLERIRLENPRYAALDTGKPQTLDAIRNTLLRGKDRMLCEFTLGDSASYLWVLTAKDLEFHRLPPREEIESQVQRLRAGLTNPLPATDADLVDAAATLYSMLFGPVKEHLEKAKTVYLVPDGSLHFIPFEVLLEEPVQAPQADLAPEARNAYFARLPYAFRKTRVLYGPSATTLSTLASARTKEKKKDPTLLAVGDPVFGTGEGAEAEESAIRTGLAPLPYTRDEVETIASYFKEDRRTTLLENAAREKTLVEPGYLSKFDILHFATHGLIDERRPDQSRLALSFPQDPSEDGYLQASEIYGLDLHADLVVLSACETGLGKMVRGEGVLGLPRAFFYAGASSIVVSLWSVSDHSTADLMSAFYQRMISRGDAPAEALRRAKEELRKTDTFAHPFYWAPFVILGPETASK